MESELEVRSVTLTSTDDSAAANDGLDLGTGMGTGTSEDLGYGNQKMVKGLSGSRSAESGLDIMKGYEVKFDVYGGFDPKGYGLKEIGGGGQAEDSKGASTSPSEANVINPPLRLGLGSSTCDLRSALQKWLKGNCPLLKTYPGDLSLIGQGLSKAVPPKPMDNMGCGAAIMSPLNDLKETFTTMDSCPEFKDFSTSTDPVPAQVDNGSTMGSCPEWIDSGTSTGSYPESCNFGTTMDSCPELKNSSTCTSAIETPDTKDFGTTMESGSELKDSFTNTNVFPLTDSGTTMETCPMLVDGSTTMNSCPEMTNSFTSPEPAQELLEFCDAETTMCSHSEQKDSTTSTNPWFPQVDIYTTMESYSEVRDSSTTMESATVETTDGFTAMETEVEEPSFKSMEEQNVPDNNLNLYEDDPDVEFYPVKKPRFYEPQNTPSMSVPVSFPRPSEPRSTRSALAVRIKMAFRPRDPRRYEEDYVPSVNKEEDQNDDNGKETENHNGHTVGRRQTGPYLRLGLSRRARPRKPLHENFTDPDLAEELY